jgi:hypothetical protein
MRPGRVAASIVLASAALAPAAAQHLESVESKDLRLVYFGATEGFLVPHVGRTFTNSLAFQRKTFGWEPSEKVTVLLTDFSDSGNAGATSVPRNSLGVEIAPLSFAFETLASNERMNTIMNHELVHVATMDQAAGADRFFRWLFSGKVMPLAEQPETILYFYLTTPRVASPRWYLEGSAVFFDTWMAGGLGRAQSPWDEMVFRSMVRDRRHFYDPLGLASEGTKIDFQLQINSYLYGTRFLSYLALHHGPEAIVRWVSRRDGSRAYYASQFRQVFGRSLDAAWRDWIAWERSFQEENLARIRQYPVTPARDLSARALGSVSRPLIDPQGQRIIAAFNYPGTVAHLGAISLKDGSVEKLRDVKGPSIYTVTSLTRDPGSGTIFYTTDNNAYRDLVALDPRARRARILIKDLRVGELVFDRTDGSLWGIRHFNGICTLVRIPRPYQEWRRVHSWPYGEVVYDLDLSPDGTLLSASFGEISGRNTLRLMPTASLLKDDATPLAEVEFGAAIPSSFVFSPDGRYLFGSTFYTGVSNIFRYEIASRSLEAVSNAETGFFRPLPLPDGRLIVFRYTGEGLLPAEIEARPLADVSAVTLLGQQIAEKHAAVREWKLGSPAAIPFEAAVVRSGSYRPPGRLGVESFYPVMAGYKDAAAAGVRLNLSDPVQLHRASLTASYSPDRALRDSERLHAQAEYRTPNWSARARYNPADFYDLFGPTKTSRKGWGVGLGYDKILLYDTPRQIDVQARADYWGGLERLPDYQNVAVAADTLFTARARLRYRDVRSSLGHVDEEKGRSLALGVEHNVVEGRGFFRAWAQADLGLALPLPHSSLWLRTSAGLSPGDPEQPYSNFYFGGFGNNWVDHGNEKRYRESPALPGLELNELFGRNYVKTMLELNLPPVRFRRAGTAGAYLTWARPALFVAGLATNLDAPARRRKAASLGAQVDLQFTFLSTLDMTLSAGYAWAFAERGRRKDEAMVSLKLLK